MRIQTNNKRASFQDVFQDLLPGSLHVPQLMPFLLASITHEANITGVRITAWPKQVYLDNRATRRQSRTIRIECDPAGS